MKRHAVIILPAAEHDIDAAYEWIAGREPEAAIHWYNRLREVIL